MSDNYSFIIKNGSCYIDGKLIKSDIGLYENKIKKIGVSLNVIVFSFDFNSSCSSLNFDSFITPITNSEEKSSISTFDLSLYFDKSLISSLVEFSLQSNK